MRHRGRPLALGSETGRPPADVNGARELAEDGGGIVETAKPRGERANRG